jgi:uncharacterized membrane protein YbhN (UPF0104 family)
MAIIVAYSAAFVLRALVWKLYIGHAAIPFRIFLNGLLYSLFLNHVLPVKVGDAARAGYLAHHSGGTVSYISSFQSVAVLRILDMLFLGGVAAAGSLYAGYSLYTGWWELFALIIFIFIPVLYFLQRKFAKIRDFAASAFSLFTSIRGAIAVLLTGLSWVLESFVLYGTAAMIISGLSFPAAWWTTSVTIAGQVFHFSPGGIGTYETVMTGTLKLLDLPVASAYEIAIASHAFKFIYSYAAGLYLWLAAPVSFVIIKKWLKKERV